MEVTVLSWEIVKVGVVVAELPLNVPPDGGT